MADTPRFRLLPLTIGCMGLLFLSKSYEVYTGGSSLLAGEAYAKAEADEAGKTEDIAAPKSAVTAEPAEGEAEAEAEGEGDKAGGEGHGDAKEGEDGKKAAAEPPAEDPVMNQPTQYSQMEVSLLQNLSARREELDKWEEDVKMKESLLQATETRLDRKIEEIKTMEAGLKTLLDEYNKHEEAEIRSLVKIYENMKPKNAAEIFDTMDMPILLMVVDMMSERKAAPILAQMKPEKAKDLTVELAETRKLRSEQRQQTMTAPEPVNGAPAQPQPKP